MADDAEPLRRKLTVILACDVAGYSRLIALDEEGTLRRFSSLSRLIHGIVGTQGGRVFNTAGDAILAEFDSAVTAVRAALEIQAAMTAAERDIAAERALAVRIGIAVGDVVVAANGDLLGDGVNIAARLQTLGDTSSVIVSDDVYRLTADKIPHRFVDLGAQTLKNIPRPVNAFRLDASGLSQPTAVSSRGRSSLLAAAIAAMVTLGGLGLWFATKRPQQAPESVAQPNRFDATKVPLVSNETRRRLVKGYADASGHKALAISNDGDFIGIAVNASDLENASERAREACERESAATHRRPCFIYAAGDRVLIEPTRFPLPLATEVSRQPAGQRFGSADTPLAAMQQGRRLSLEYPAERRPKALAIGARGEGVWGAMSTGETVDEAIRRSLEFCGLRAPGPCVLYAINDELVTRPPQTMRIVGVLTFAADKVIPQGERQRLLDTYKRGDWQAVSRGANGTWHAAAGHATEADTIAAVMGACQQADRDCRVYAIGRFLVAP